MILWPEEHDAQLRIEHRTTATFSEIAEVLNKRFGTQYSRNAVIGRAQRLKLPARKSPIKPKPAAVVPTMKSTDRLRVAPGAQVQAINRGPKMKADPFKGRTADVVSLRKIIVELVMFVECHWADDEPNAAGETTFCGHRTCDGSNWCEAHQKIAWQPRQTPAKQNPLYRNDGRRAA
ncbi:MAG: GcrA family cell cycle regulator [Xanthobacteraceae bacterium]